jgi:hypothetical protein
MSGPNQWRSLSLKSHFGILSEEEPAKPVRKGCSNRFPVTRSNFPDCPAVYSRPRPGNEFIVIGDCHWGKVVRRAMVSMHQKDLYTVDQFSMADRFNGKTMLDGNLNALKA